MQNRRPLAPIDDLAVAEFWRQFLSVTDRPSETPLLDAWRFGDSAELADQLLELVMTGPKRATVPEPTGCGSTRTVSLGGTQNSASRCTPTSPLSSNASRCCMPSSRHRADRRGCTQSRD